MAETQQKRLRSENPEEENSNPKRQKPYNNILSLLDDEEEEDEEQNHDLSAIFTTLEREISSPAAFDFASPPEDERKSGDEDDESVRSVMRHLLEASDDELGIPNTDDLECCNNNNNVYEIGSDEGFDSPFGFVDNGLWELEDEAANYYTVLQSELFMSPLL